jgi:hypothetical protein
MIDYVTAAAKDIVSAAGIAAWDPRRNAAVARATHAMQALDFWATGFGPVLRDSVWSGFFKLSANEPNRLAKLVDSVILLRTEDVAQHLLRYDDEN